MIELCVEKGLKLGGSGDDGPQHTDRGILQHFDLSGIDEGRHFYFKDPVNVEKYLIHDVYHT